MVPAKSFFKDTDVAAVRLRYLQVKSQWFIVLLRICAVNRRVASEEIKIDEHWKRIQCQEASQKGCKNY